MPKPATDDRLQARGRLFAIGDIHGCPDELQAVLRAADPCATDTVVFMGDYIDRGPASRQVIDLLLEFAQGAHRTVFLKGNHEDMMLSFLGLPGRYGDSFLINGGFTTLQSYGLNEADLDDTRARLPATHVEFLSQLSTSYRHDRFLFVHAGISPLHSLAEQDPEDLMWIRQEFILNPHTLDLTVLFGHTPVREVLLDLPYKIGIDTGLVYGGKLTCLELTQGECLQVSRGNLKVKRHRLTLA
ncbi:MAG TPA: metallophosphoesterase family protein [Candidatus Binataceae bacterium]|nr:metallophosphoesterase family protein [Candidatus Binataceae bacterium]